MSSSKREPAHAKTQQRRPSVSQSPVAIVIITTSALFFIYTFLFFGPQTASYIITMAQQYDQDLVNILVHASSGGTAPVLFALEFVF
jgi:hypothetical protein